MNKTQQLTTASWATRRDEKRNCIESVQPWMRGRILALEEESGVGEFDASNRSLIWSIFGGQQRFNQGLADALVDDDADQIAKTVRDLIAQGVPRFTGANRSTSTAHESLRSITPDNGIRKSCTPG